MSTSTLLLSTTANSVALEGNVEVLQQMVANRHHWDRRTTIIIAARRGHLNILQWYGQLVVSNPVEYQWPNSITDNAAECGQTEVLAYLRTQSVKWSPNICSLAASRGHLDTVRYLREACGCYCYQSTCTAAASNGHLEVLQYLRSDVVIEGENRARRIVRCPWSQNTCIEAANNNHLHVLRWALRHNCPVNFEQLEEEITNEAALALLRSMDCDDNES